MIFSFPYVIIGSQQNKFVVMIRIGYGLISNADVPNEESNYYILTSRTSILRNLA